MSTVTTYGADPFEPFKPGDKVRIVSEVIVGDIGHGGNYMATADDRLWHADIDGVVSVRLIEPAKPVPVPLYEVGQVYVTEKYNYRYLKTETGWLFLTGKGDTSARTEAFVEDNKRHTGELKKLGS